jgi:hypothetical protein
LAVAEQLELELVPALLALAATAAIQPDLVLLPQAVAVVESIVTLKEDQADLEVVVVLVTARVLTTLIEVADLLVTA